MLIITANIETSVEAEKYTHEIVYIRYRVQVHAMWEF